MTDPIQQIKERWNESESFFNAMASGDTSVLMSKQDFKDIKSLLDLVKRMERIFDSSEYSFSMARDEYFEIKKQIFEKEVKTK